MPSPLLATSDVPVTSAPMKLPCNTLLELLTVAPPELFPEITLRAPFAVPPMEFPGASKPMLNPKRLLPRACVPLASVPRKFPSTTLFVEAGPVNSMPSLRLPEMTLRAVGVVPPTTLPGEPLSKIPSPVFERTVTPSVSRPMKFPSMTL